MKQKHGGEGGSRNHTFEDTFKIVNVFQFEHFNVDIFKQMYMRLSPITLKFQ